MTCELVNANRACFGCLVRCPVFRLAATVGVLRQLPRAKGKRVVNPGDYDSGPELQEEDDFAESSDDEMQMAAPPAPPAPPAPVTNHHDEVEDEDDGEVQEVDQPAPPAPLADHDDRDQDGGQGDDQEQR